VGREQAGIEAERVVDGVPEAWVVRRDTVGVGWIGASTSACAGAGSKGDIERRVEGNGAALQVGNGVEITGSGTTTPSSSKARPSASIASARRSSSAASAREGMNGLTGVMGPPC